MKKIILAVLLCSSISFVANAQLTLHDYTANSTIPTGAGNLGSFGSFTAGNLGSPSITDNGTTTTFNVNNLGGGQQYFESTFAAFDLGTSYASVVISGVVEASTTGSPFIQFAILDAGAAAYEVLSTVSLGAGAFSETLNFTAATDFSSILGFQFNIQGVGGPSDTASVTLDNISLVPEPSSFALMGLGMGALYLLRRRR